MISENNQKDQEYIFKINSQKSNFFEKSCCSYKENNDTSSYIEVNNYPFKRVYLSNDNIKIQKFEKSKVSNIEEIQFPNGAVKVTAVKGYIKKEYDITIEDVFQKEILKAAVLSAFVIDPVWVLSKIQLSNTVVVFVHQAKSEKEKQAINEMYLCLPNVSAIFPSMEGANCMHCKLQLLFYTTYLRVVIPSANLVDYDWGETGVMENSMYIHDFPRRTSEFTNFSTSFESDLFYYCKAKGYPEHILKKMHCYDFSTSKNVHFVHSIPLKALNNNDIRDTGYLSLATAIQRLGKTIENHIKVDIMVTSSLGSLESTFLSNIYHALKGDKINSCTTNVQSWKTCIRVHFPSINTVLSSNGGKESAGTICLQKKFWEHPEFPKNILYDSTSVHKGCLMHHKIILVKNYISSFSFFYIGSANLSASAWGIPIQKKTKRPVILCRNWESGVILSLDDYHSCIIEAMLCETKMFYLKNFSAEKGISLIRYQFNFNLRPCKLNNLYNVYSIRPVLRTKEISRTSHRFIFCCPFSFKIRHIYPNYIASKNRNIKIVSRSTLYENIYTIPNFLTLSRLVLSPVAGYLVLNEQHLYATILFIYASLSDMLDGWVSRKWNAKSIAGTILDPMADKFFVIILTLCLSIQQQIPFYLSSVIIGKDILLMLFSIYYRWISLDPPRTFLQYFDFSIPSVEVKPTLISKVNTALQHLLIGTTIVRPLIHSDIISIFLNPLQYLVFTTTIWSFLSYMYTKEAIRILKVSKNNE
ncbi:hypothetical protein PORY_002462 [Pneumocystis oryctolagi]|uniref:Uncharacterized protein n=1 Tax=Pneumocystis oryctolagi TaxID=42067 RepID=A0ACB7CAZ2_9ASCO|nr:hypothetical protein PORY_002462 [Pneumocystis oryctolagi]